MLSFMEKKASSAKLAEWSPSDWPESLPEMRAIDNLLRCSICYEFFDVALIIPECSHNYCSLCIRRSLSYETQCPTCSLKVAPPSLKNNRVLDEIVKNFIKVRTKLLELATSSAQITSSQATDKKGGAAKNKRSIDTPKTNTKRRKAHSSSQNSLNSSSPDTKRQKLDTENDPVMVPVEEAKSDKMENSSGGSTPEVAVIGLEEQLQEPQRSEQQPVAIDECRSEKGQPSQPQDPDLAECPVCGDMVLHRNINSHLDACLNRTEKKSSLRRKKSSEPTTSKSSKRKSPVDIELQDSPAGSSGDSGSSAVKQEASSTASSSNLTIQGSNALIRMIQKRKPLPKLVYSVMSDKELLKRLKEWNLSTKGDRSTLTKRHQDFVMLYNSQCDSEKPMTAAQIAKEVEKAELTRAREASSGAEASTSHGIRFAKDQSEEEMDKTRHKYLNEHKQDFDKLIADVQKRQKGKRNKSATKTSASESLDVKKIDPMEEDLKKSVQEESDNTKHTNKQEINDNMETSGAQGCPPFFKKSNPVSSNDDDSRTSSIIPEPPSSPSLASLEEDECTPSLGLEDDDWELGDEESEDPNVIPESPVIKVGSRAKDESANKETVLSESDDECQQTFVKNKRVKSNLF